MGTKFDSNKKYPLNVTIRLSLQRALLCEVSKNLRMVAYESNEEERLIIVYFFFDENITEENKESVNSILAEFSGDFDEKMQIIDRCIRLDYPKKLPMYACTIYRRKE